MNTNPNIPTTDVQKRLVNLFSLLLMGAACLAVLGIAGGMAAGILAALIAAFRLALGAGC